MFQRCFSHCSQQERNEATDLGDTQQRSRDDARSYEGYCLAVRNQGSHPPHARRIPTRYCVNVALRTKHRGLRQRDSTVQSLAAPHATPTVFLRRLGRFYCAPSAPWALPLCAFGPFGPNPWPLGPPLGNPRPLPNDTFSESQGPLAATSANHGGVRAPILRRRKIAVTSADPGPCGSLSRPRRLRAPKSHRRGSHPRPCPPVPLHQA
jgi:hypothetical protein